MDKRCFFISPIGAKESKERERSNKIIKHILKPVLEDKFKFVLQRADDFNSPSLITPAILEAIFRSELVICDLTYGNPNVFYELAIRHTIGMPVINLIEEGHRIPFDIQDQNSIYIKHTEIESVTSAKEKIEKQIESLFKNDNIMNPVSTAAKLYNIDITSLIKYEKQRDNEDIANAYYEVVRKLEKDYAMLFNQLIEFKRSQNTLGIDGIWDSNMGKVQILQNKDNIKAEYQYFDNEYIGEIEGKIIGELIIFKWKWKNNSSNGIGYFKHCENRLEGAWFYEQDVPSFESILIDPEILLEKDVKKHLEWNVDLSKPV